MPHLTRRPRVSNVGLGPITFSLSTRQGFPAARTVHKVNAPRRCHHVPEIPVVHLLSQGCIHSTVERVRLAWSDNLTTSISIFLGPHQCCSLFIIIEVTPRTTYLCDPPPAVTRVFLHSLPLLSPVIPEGWEQS